MIFHFISKVVFATNFHYYINFNMRFDLNYNIYFNYNKFYFDNEMIIRNLFNFNNKMYNRIYHIDFDLML